MNPYIKLLSRKRTWTPVQTSKGKLKEGAEETIYRALAIRHMELPVGAFITEALDKNVPDSARALLESNVKDEIKHDLALGYITNALGVDEKAEAEALRLRAAWEEHPDHTICKALVAERAIFFVLLPFLDVAVTDNLEAFFIVLIKLASSSLYENDLENWKKSILEFLGEDKVIVESVHKSYLENFKLGPPNRLEQRIIHWQNIYKDFLNASGISF